MAFQARMYTDCDTGTVTIRLVGDLDSGSAGRLNELIGQASREPVRRLVLLMDRLNYLSSAGLRCLVYAHQKFGPGDRHRARRHQAGGGRHDPADRLDHSVIMQDPADV